MTEIFKNLKRKKMFGLTTATVLILAFLMSCRGELSNKPPIHLNVNMDIQTKKNAQSLSMEMPKGTVPYGYDVEPEADTRERFIKEDKVYYTGKDGERYIQNLPVDVDRDLIKKGQKNYGIFCAACHDRVGTGMGIVIKRGVGFPPPADLSSQRIVNLSDGQLFEIITQGIRNMPGYKTQIETDERWAIVSYLRVLQTARNASRSDVPSGVELK